MVVVFHETVCEQSQAKFRDCFAEKGEKRSPVLLVAEDGAFFNSSIENMVVRSLELNPEWSRHANIMQLFYYKSNIRWGQTLQGLTPEGLTLNG